jgi:hypothetical protein
MWDSRRILKDLTDVDRKRKVAIAFWKYSDAQPKALVTAKLAQAMRFRDESFRKLPMEKKADFLAQRSQLADYTQFFDIALLQYHTHEMNELMGVFLDAWKIPHENGEIEAEEYSAPTSEQARDAVAAAGDRFDKRDVAIYFATAGLMMGDDWRASLWPVVDELAPQLATASA